MHGSDYLLLLLACVGKALPRILTDETQYFNDMLERDLLSRYYESGILVGPYEAAVAYLKILTFKDPRLRVLEAGTGTGGCTKWLSRGLSDQNGALGLQVESRPLRTSSTNSLRTHARNLQNGSRSWSSGRWM